MISRASRLRSWLGVGWDSKPFGQGVTEWTGNVPANIRRKETYPLKKAAKKGDYVSALLQVRPAVTDAKQKGK